MNVLKMLKGLSSLDLVCLKNCQHKGYIQTIEILVTLNNFTEFLIAA